MIKDLLPYKYRDILRRTYNFTRLWRYILADYGHIVLLRNNTLTVEKIIQQYHRVEKSLSKIPFNQSRGKRAAVTLLLYLESYLKDNQPESQVVVGFKVLNQYADRVKWFRDMYQSRIDLIKSICLSFSEADTLPSGFEMSNKKLLYNSSFSSFSELCNARKSIRYFDSVPVNKDILLKAFDIAKKTPSACNRQGWFTWIISSEDGLELFQKIHNGFSDKKQNLSTLLVICYDKLAYEYPHERHQGIVDSSLYAMSIMYALTSLGVASCPLNANLNIKDTKLFKKRIGITERYSITMFIAVGNYIDLNISPISYRSDPKFKIKHY